MTHHRDETGDPSETPILAAKGNATAGWLDFVKTMKLSMGSLSSGRQWKEATEGTLKGYDLGEATELTDVQIYSLHEKIRFLPVTVFQRWSTKQLDAISERQIHQLSPLQLQAIISNPSINAQQVYRLIEALSQVSHYHKIGDLLQGLEHAHDALEIQRWCFDAVQLQDDTHCRKVLSVVAQTASSLQFNGLLQQFPFERIIRLFEGDRYEVHSHEFQALSTEIEQEEFNLNLELQDLEGELQRLDEVWCCSSIQHILAMAEASAKQETTTAEFDAALEAVADNTHKIYDHVKQATKLSPQWQQLFERSIKRNSHPATSVLRSFAQCFRDYRGERAYHRRCLIDKNLTALHFVNHWKEEYLPNTYANVEHVSDTELDPLFQQARKDTYFLESVMDWFYKKVQKDAQCGTFSIHFLLRLLVQKVFEPTHLFLATEEIEEILLMPGMLELLELVELSFSMDKILHQLASKVARNLRAA